MKPLLWRWFRCIVLVLLFCCWAFLSRTRMVLRCIFSVLAAGQVLCALSVRPWSAVGPGLACPRCLRLGWTEPRSSGVPNFVLYGPVLRS